jgi:hypothetical protein
MIETITGINPTILGATPEERTPVRTTQMAVRGTENILRPMIRGLKNSKRRIAERFALSIPLMIRNNPKSKQAYEVVIGKHDVEVLKQISDDIHSMGIRLEPKLTQSAKDDMMRIIELAMQKDAQGGVGLGVAEAMLIQERILGGQNLKLVRMEVTSMLREAEQRLLAQREHLIRVQGEETRALEGQKHQEALQKADIDAKVRIDVDNNQFQNSLKLLQAKSNIQIMEDMLYEEGGDDAEQEIAT